MGDMADDMRALKQHAKERREMMLAQADTKGWKEHTPYHFSRVFGGQRMDWWPSGGKAQYKGRMIYGHRNVNDLIARLRARETSND